MKTHSALLLLAVTALSAPAQIDDLRGAGQYVATERGSFHTRWESAAPTNTPGAGTFIELGTSLNHFDETTGKWLPSEEIIEPVPGGAVARRGALRVSFNNNLATYGAIDLQYGSLRMRSHLLGLGYSDPTTGKAAFIAEVQDCQGFIASNSVVVYPEAMPGISVRYRYTRASLEQDVVISSADALPAPEALGMNPSTTILQAYSEFIDSPVPLHTERILTTELDEQLVEETLDFGLMSIGPGWAFRVDAPSARNLPVRKQWLLLDGGARHILVEEVPLPALLHEFNRGSRGEGASITPTPPRTRQFATVAPTIPARKDQTAGKTGKPMEMVAANLKNIENGIILDYAIISAASTNSFTLEGGMTYYVSGLFSVGTLTIEGNSVTKFPIASTASIVATNVLCKTDLYRPAVFTASADDAHGESLGETLDTTAFYGNVALDLSRATATHTLSNLRFLHLSNALSGASITLKHSQVARCKNAFAAGSTAPVLHNVLLYRLNSLLPNSAAAQVTGVNVTAHSCTNFLANTTGSIRLTNCLFAAVTNWQCSTTLTNSSAFLLADDGVFESTGASDHYLPASSPFLHAGNAGIDAGLLAALRLRTTYPPLVYSNLTISADTTFYPQAERDFGEPSIGYHFDPLDHVFGGVTANANLTFAPGTAVGWFRVSSSWQHEGHGITLADQKVATFDGRAENPTYWVRCSTVQEGVNGLWAGGFGPGGITGWAWPDIADSPEIVARFTRFSALAADSTHYRDDWGWLTVRATHCEFYGGYAGGYNNRQCYTNCLWDRVILWQSTGWPDSEFTMQNCTMRGGILGTTRFDYGANIPVVIRECAFDKTAIQDTSGGNTTYDYNATLSGQNSVVPAGAGDMVLTSFNWQTGPLGSFYLPATSWLVNTSVVTADVIGLYHFTTQTNQAKESNSRLDCGYHYPAVERVRFIGTNDVTQGNWKGAYGTEGCGILMDATAYPAYATLTWSGALGHTWDSAPTEARTLQRLATGRISACYYNGASFTLTLLPSDGKPHRVALYFLDGDSTTRAQTVTVSDPVTAQTLDNRSIANFHDGKYLVWDIVGSVNFTFIRTGTANAVCSGVFFDQGAVHVADGDGDGILDIEEDGNGNGSFEGGDLADFADPDSDNDDVWDGVEVLQGRNPLSSSTQPDNGQVNLRVFTPLKP